MGPVLQINIGICALGGLGDWLDIGIAFALAISAAIYAFGRISGAVLGTLLYSYLSRG